MFLQISNSKFIVNNSMYQIGNIFCLKISGGGGLRPSLNLSGRGECCPAHDFTEHNSFTGHFWIRRFIEEEDFVIFHNVCLKKRIKTADLWSMSPILLKI